MNYTEMIIEMVKSIDNASWLCKIYSFVKAFADDAKHCTH